MKETEVKTSAEMGRRDARKIKVRITVCAGCGSRDATLYKVKDAQGPGWICLQGVHAEQAAGVGGCVSRQQPS